MKSGKKRKGKRKKQHTISLFSSLKQMFIWAVVLTIAFVGLMYLYPYLYPVEKTIPGEKPIAKKKEIIEKPQQKKPSRSSSVQKKKLTFPEKAEIPRLQTKKEEQVIYHEGYTVSYNSNYKIANWVAWELTAKEAQSKKVERKNKFVSDPKVKGATARNEDYTRTGYDRGHLAPAGDMKWSDKAMRESFYLSNICPQDPALNRGVWKTLEEQSRLWALDYEVLLIAAGPVIKGDLKRLGTNRIGVPTHFYKVICTITDNKYQGIAFLLENKDYKNVSLQSLAIPIDSVEKVTGIDFFHLLPDDQERIMESKVDLDCWSF
ncbi:DNA/RNA non-specific endonuclease [Parabacteroides sp. PM5-20]|uniref:DNA/RNA non-specific endonuclease n=2 Tax=unclassified Parabacteroides TaxID=2649774 RepID=UPI0024755734|nr:DNA/RNA non-specific endonuclease [Parabacteroides sp. PM5-20]